MLSREICRQCVEQGIPRFANFAWEVWESRWDQGVVCCFTGSRDTTSQTNAADLDVKKEPPDYCPFTLEHVLEEKK